MQLPLVCIWSSPQTLSPQTSSLGEWLPFLLAFGAARTHTFKIEKILERGKPEQVTRPCISDTQMQGKQAVVLNEHTHTCMHMYVHAPRERHTHARGQTWKLAHIRCSAGIIVLSWVMVSPVLSGSLVVARSCFDPGKGNRLNLIKKSPPQSHFLIAFCFASRTWSQVLVRERTRRCLKRSRPVVTLPKLLIRKKVSGCGPNASFLGFFFLLPLLLKHSPRKIVKVRKAAWDTWHRLFVHRP